jgi:hypothetical protein
MNEEIEKKINALVEDTFLNEYDSKEFIRACVWEHYERELNEE